jgi:transcription elongation factor GreA
MANNENILTKKGKEDLESKLSNLINVEKPKALSDLNLARSQGDLSENADYDAAREKCQQIETEISKISYILDHSSIIESTDGAKTCRLGGGPITVKNISTKQEYTFTIVGSAEADPINGKISNTCPVAQAVIGHCEGNTVTVPVKNPYELQIKKIGA